MLQPSLMKLHVATCIIEAKNLLQTPSTNGRRRLTNWNLWNVSQIAAIWHTELRAKQFEMCTEEKR